jgi:type IV fimbrial biogenesis protein FimT
MDTKHRTHTRRFCQNGVSLVEAMIVIAVTAIVAATAAPSLASFIDGRRLDAAATALAADVQFVRTEAVARNRPIRLSFHASAASSCWVVHTGPAAQCTCAESGPAVCSGGATQIKTVVLGAADRVSVQANVASIVFDPLHGTSTPTGTLRLIDPRGRAVHHIVTVMGRVRSCTPGGAVPGWRAC